MFKVLKVEQKYFLDDTLDSSTFTTKSNSNFIINTNTNSNTISIHNNPFIISYKKKDFLGKKRFITKNRYSKIKKIDKEKISYGLWNKSEHNKFIEALYIYNCEWEKIKEYLGNRTRNQIRSHSQKFFLRLKNFKDIQLGLDFTSMYINNLKIIVDMIKQKEKSLNISIQLLYIISEKISFGKNVGEKDDEKDLLSTKTDNNNDLSEPKYKENISDFKTNRIKIENNKEEIETSSEYYLSSLDSNREQEVDEISIVDSDIRKNIIFLQI